MIHVSTLQSPKGAFPFNGAADPRYTSAYDLFVEGHTYAEIAITLGTDIFQVMNDVAQEAALHAAQTTRAPWLELQWAQDQLRKVVKTAWDRNGEILGEKGGTYDGLPVIVQATRELVKNSEKLSTLLRAMQAQQEETEEEKLPEGSSPKDFQQMGRDLVRKRFPNLRAVNE